MVFYLNNRKVTNTKVGSIAVAVKNMIFFLVERGRLWNFGLEKQLNALRA